MEASFHIFLWKKRVEKAFSRIFIEGKMSIRGTVYTNKPVAHNLTQQEESKTAHIEVAKTSASGHIEPYTYFYSYCNKRPNKFSILLRKLQDETMILYLLANLVGFLLGARSLFHKICLATRESLCFLKNARSKRLVKKKNYLLCMSPTINCVRNAGR
jgi:hypothetical protein